MKPNIFNLATKELSQDAFFTWLLQWADDSHNQHNPELNETAKDFVRLLLGRTSDFQINKVEARRQQHYIDIWIEVNNTYLIIIEDKTNTGQHSGQLVKYKEIAQQWCVENKYEEPICIYLKTGNESLSSLKIITEGNYTIIGRKAVLDILKMRQVTNEIFNDFKDYLAVMENATNSFTKLSNITSEWRAGEGFYLYLQEHMEKEISKFAGWKYVPNKMNGFLGFWYYWIGVKGVGTVYIQIENAFKYGIKLVIKIGEWNQSINTLRGLLGELTHYAQKNGLSILKPNKFKTGKTSTVAVIQNAFSSDSNGNIELDKFMATLKKLEQTLKDYSESKK